MKISVVIPVYNSEKTIEKCIGSLLNQTRKPDEIIVVDDRSKDRTSEIAKSFKNVTLLEKNHEGPAAARNLGAKKAKGEILLFIDSDCIADKNWVSEMVKPFENKQITGVQGIYKTSQKGLMSRFVQLEIEDRYERMKKFETIDFVGSYSAGYRKRIFLKFKGFDESFPIASGEDPELSFKLSKAGHKMVLNEMAIVYHNHVNSLGDYLKQKFWRAYWRILLYRKHPEKITSESYTPQSLKSQIIVFYLFALSVVFSASLPYVFYISLLLLILLILSTIPLSYKNFSKDKAVGVSTPFVLIMRTVVFSLGLIYGVIRI
ncbi:MAG: glycosyltransferase [Candidatus Aenigmatarchaeota archaeon]|nr:MAG: glycosyltransferase [Candidatus Aenigmarchaeota archaeon]